MESLLLLFLAIAPAAALLWFIYWMDRHEPECLKDVLKVVLVGALSTLPAIIVQLSLEDLPLFQLGGITGGFFESFLLVAPSEEFFKFLFVYLFIRKKHFYSEINDGIVYYGAGALGFALLENIFYVFDYGFTVGIMRAFTAIPLHTFCGVLVGYHAGLARFTEQPNPRRLLVRGLFLAYLTHATYNTLLSAESAIVFFFVPLVIIGYYAGYRILHRGRQLSLAGLHDLPDGLKPLNGKISSAPPLAPADGMEAKPEEAAIAMAVFPAMPVSGRQPSALPPPLPLKPMRVTNYREEDVRIDEQGRHYLKPKKELWKALIARTLLAINILLWLVVLLFGEISAEEMLDIVIGMIILTVVPFMISIILEMSYRRRQREIIYLDVPFS